MILPNKNMLILLFVGQIISMLGSAMTTFSLTIWAFEQTGKAAPLALMGFFYFTPLVMLGPFVGFIIDKFSRKKIIIGADLLSSMSTLFILILFVTNHLQIWHLFVATAWNGVFQGFQWPAFSASLTQLINKNNYARANAILQLSGSSSSVFAPLLAGYLITKFDLIWILYFDLLTAGLAVIILIGFPIHHPKISVAGFKAKGNILYELTFGFRYIWQKPSLRNLQIIFLIANTFSTIALAVLSPMILYRSDRNMLVFGSVQSAGAIGGIVGAIILLAWGGPKNKVNGVLLGWFCFGILGLLTLGVGKNQYLWVIGNFFCAISIQIIDSSSQALWQSKVEPDIQGRVFAARRFIAWSVIPLTFLIAGPLADLVMEPMMSAGTNISNRLFWLVGNGPGAGIALMFVVSGLCTAVAGICGYLFSTIRSIESILVDIDDRTKEISY